MKKLSLVLVAILFAVTGILAQTPNQFKYQAVLRDASGAIMASQAVTVDISILQGSASGTSVFTEQHSVTTTAQGLINLNIGSENDLSVVDWSADIYFIEISVNSTVMGTSQLLSVPYAMNAKTAETVDYANVTNTPTIPSDLSDLTDNTNLLFDRDYNSLSNLPTLFDGQWSSLTGTTPNVGIFNNDAGYLTSFTELDPNFTTNFDLTSASNGDLLQYNGTKFVKFTPNYLTSEVDGSVTNEIQDLELTSNTLKITNNTSATNIDLSTYLDDQTVTFTNGTGINVTGTYPDFTVINTAPDQTVTIAGGTGISVTGTYPDFTVTNTATGGTHYLGEEFDGGIIFNLYIGSDGQQHGLIVSKTEATSTKWQNTGTTTNANRTEDGLYNTGLMTDSPAKTWATGLGAGWYLPSIDELSLLWHNRYYVNKTSRANGYTLLSTTDRYWSSTESSSTHAWTFYFINGYVNNGHKTSTWSVRAVRAF